MDDALTPELWLRIGLALACGAAMGLERQLRGKPAGIRTCALICVGSMLFVRLGGEVEPGEAGDPARVLGQVVVGVGFLGAGVILSLGGVVRGVTSAAVIWILAGVGAAIGLSRYGSAVAVSGVVLVVLVVVEWLERLFKSLRRGVHSHDENGRAKAD